MKTRLFISSNYLTMLEACYVIEENNDGYENHLMIVSFGCKRTFFIDMLKFAQRLQIFDKIFFFNDFLMPNNLFNFEQLEKLANIKGYDEIYSTCFYMQGKIFIEKYKDAKFCLLSNGTASYQPQSLLGDLYKRAEGFYYLDYFNKTTPYLCSDLGVKAHVINKEYMKNKFLLLSEQIPNIQELKQNSIVLIAQNLYISKLATPAQEFNEYKNIMDYYVSNGHHVYFKNHPRSPQTFYNPIKDIYKDKVSVLGGYDTLPTESLIYKIEPSAVVSLCSTALFNIQDMYDIPSYTFSMTFEMKESPIKIAYAMVKSYFNDYDKTTINPLMELPDLSYAPLYQMLLYRVSRNFINKENFIKIQEYLKNESYSEKYKILGIDEKLFNIFKSQNL